jgi:hypothetical protein
MSPDDHVEEAAATVWPVLPVVGLRLANVELKSPALLRHLQQLRGLTELTLGLNEYGVQAHVTFSEVAGMVRQLPALQHLSLQRLRFKATVDAREKGRPRGMYHNAAGVEELLEAIGCLRQLNSLYVFIRLMLLQAAAQKVTGKLPQLVGRLLAPWCTVEANLLRIDTREEVEKYTMVL